MVGRLRAIAAPLAVWALAAIVLTGCPHEPPTGFDANYTYIVVDEFPHDRAAFTQGLVCDNGVLFEGTGLFGASTLRRVDLATGDVLQSTDLAEEHFGEGIDVVGDTIIQLTWRSHIGFIYNKETFEPVGDFEYTSEGWGITNDGERLIMSDGTPTIRFLDPETFAQIGEIQVFDTNGPVRRLNELEFIDGHIFANVWLTDFIAIIDPETGEVVSWIDLTGLRPQQTLGDGDAVLNGIAYNAAEDRLFVTGKRWPAVFEIDLVPVEELAESET